MYWGLHIAERSSKLRTVWCLQDLTAKESWRATLVSVFSVKWDGRIQIAVKKWEVRKGRVKAKHLSRCLAERVAGCCETRST